MQTDNQYNHEQTEHVIAILCTHNNNVYYDEFCESRDIYFILTRYLHYNTVFHPYTCNVEIVLYSNVNNIVFIGKKMVTRPFELLNL